MTDTTIIGPPHDHDKRVHELFMQVVDLPEEEWRAFLDKACGDDSATRNEVLELLRLNDQPITSPANGTTASRQQDALALPRGETIGPYTIVDALGEGGFGVVYLAKQTTPVKRLVALKIIKPGMDTKAVIARFEAERQALAMMDHSSIARVYEAGATPEGRPYFAMEFVKGEPINAYCDRHKLDTQARLELFAQVCDAIQHAHQKGVIHRDLKPGNILVTIDARHQPQPKVIDFGIAKATAQSLTEKTLFTEQGQLIGTPEYMSPEQAEMSAVNVDTRSDVYSLGVILYELLSGKLPFDPEALREAGFAEIQRIIREEDPPKPSTKLTTVQGEEATRIAQAHSIKLAELQSTLRKELEWIPLKALRKNRTERYSSAEALGDDVRRYLNGEPLEAGPESAAYRFKKLVRRNKGPFIAAALIALALIAGIIGTTIFAVQAETNARRAEAKSAEAELEAARATAVKNFVTTMLSSVDPDIAQGMDTELLMLVLSQSAESIGTQFQDKPIVAAEIHSVIAETYDILGLSEEAIKHNKDALTIRRRVLGDTNLNTMVSLNMLGLAYQDNEDMEQAERYLQESLDMRRLHLSGEHLDIAVSLNNLGLLYANTERYDEAEALLVEALETRRRFLGDDDEQTLTSINNMGFLRWQQGLEDEALEYYLQAMEGRRRVLGDRNIVTINSLQNVAQAANVLGMTSLARKHLLEAVEACRTNLEPDHPLTLITLNNMGLFYWQNNELEEAEVFYQESLDGRRRRYGPVDTRTLTAIGNMGRLLESQRKYPEAEAMLREALEGRRAEGNDKRSTIGSIHNLGSLLRNMGKLTEAEALGREAVERGRRVLPAGHWHLALFLKEHALTLAELEQFEQARDELRESHAIFTESFGEDNARAITGIKRLAELHDAWHETEPDGGHDATAAQYRAQLDDLQQKDAAAPKPTLP